MNGGSLHVSGAVDTVRDCVGAAARDHAHAQLGARQVLGPVVRVHALVSGCARYQAVHHLGERAVPSHTHHSVVSRQVLLQHSPGTLVSSRRS